MAFKFIMPKFDKPEDYWPYILAGFIPSVPYPASSFQNGKGVSIEQGIQLIKLGFVRAEMRVAPEQGIWWVGPIQYASDPGFWVEKPWPHLNEPEVQKALA